MDTNTISDGQQNKIVELSSKLAEYDAILKYHVIQDILFDENGNYLTVFQDEFNVLYDRYYNELKNLICVESVFSQKKGTNNLSKKRAMDIIIKNVTGHPSNDWAIFELKRAGFPAGSKVYNVTYSPENNSCQWSSVSCNCVAWLGETCEELPEMKIENQ